MSKKNEAKKNALLGLKKKMQEMGGESMKATVVAKSEDGLKKGLEKASEVVDKYEIPKSVKDAKDSAMESADEFTNMSKEELIKRLKK